MNRWQLLQGKQGTRENQTAGATSSPGCGEAVEHGQEQHQLQDDDQEEWCLSCLAKKAVAEYLAG